MAQSVGEIIRKYIEDYVIIHYNMVLPQLEFTDAAENGDNFASDVFRVKITGMIEYQSEERSRPTSLCFSTLNLIVKVSPQDAIPRQMYSTTLLFTRECYTYTRIFPAFEEFQLQHIDKSQIFSNYPRLLAYNLEESSEFILLEDLCCRDYHTSYRPHPLPYPKCKSVLKALAQFHAISFAFKEQKRTEFSELTSLLDEITFKEKANNLLDPSLRHFIECGLSTLSGSDQDQKIKMQLQELQVIDTNLMRECLSAKEDAVVLHGDCWMSNLLFKDEDNMKFVDWQGTRYGSPVIDLSYFLFCCTDSKLRIDLPELLKCYHTELTNRMAQLGSDGEKLFPFSKLEMHMKKFARFGLGMAILTLHVTTCDPNDMPNLRNLLNLQDSSAIENLTNELVSRSAYRERISDVCRDFIKFGYL